MTLKVLILSAGLGTAAGCTAWKTAHPDAAPPAPAARRDDIAAMLQFANRIRTLPDANRRALVREWEERVAGDGSSGDAALHLAVVLCDADHLISDALVRARTLLTAYLADTGNKPAVLLDFARLQLGTLEEKASWRTASEQEQQAQTLLEQNVKALDRERRIRRELEQKLEALKAIERRMTDKNGDDKVPLR